MYFEAKNDDHQARCRCLPHLILAARGAVLQEEGRKVGREGGTRERGSAGELAILLSALKSTESLARLAALYSSSPFPSSLSVTSDEPTRETTRFDFRLSSLSLSLFLGRLVREI